MDSINKLIEYFSEFPGIGPRQAKRFAYFLLTKNKSYLESLTKNINELKQSIRTCGQCFKFYTKDEIKKLKMCPQIQKLPDYF